MLLELLDGVEEWLLEVSTDLLLLELLVTALDWLVLDDDIGVLLEDEAALVLVDDTGVLLEDEAGLLLEMLVKLLDEVGTGSLLDVLTDALLEWLVLNGVLDWLLLVPVTAVLMLTALVERLLPDVEAECTLEGVLELDLELIVG